MVKLKELYAAFLGMTNKKKQIAIGIFSVLLVSAILYSLVKYFL